MRIGIDISQTVYPGTGAATYTNELVKELVKQDQKNDYLFFGGSLRLYERLKTNAGQIASGKKYHFTHLPPSVLNILWNDLHMFPIENFTGKIDLFHASDATQPPTKKAKIVTTVHDLVCYTFPETLDPKQLKIQKRRLELVKKEANGIIAVSESTKRDLIEKLAIGESRITVIAEAVSPRFHAGLKNDLVKLDEIRKKYQLPAKYLLNVGTIQPRKNLPRLLEAYRQLSTPPMLVIAGSIGWGKDIAYTPNVYSIGYIDAADLPYLYAGAYAFIYPSLYEGFGLPVLEAMACGTPVVTSNVSSLPEVGGQAAIYVDPVQVDQIKHGLEQVLTLTEKEYRDRQALGLTQAAQFSWQKTAQQTLAFYEKVGGSL